MKVEIELSHLKLRNFWTPPTGGRTDLRSIWQWSGHWLVDPDIGHFGSLQNGQIIRFFWKKKTLDSNTESFLRTWFYSLQRQFCIVNYWDKVHPIISVMKTYRLVFPEKWYFKNSSFWHFHSPFVLKTTETSMFMFSLLRLFNELLTE